MWGIWSVRISIMFPWSTEKRDCRAFLKNSGEAEANHNDNGKQIRINKKDKNKY